MFDKLKKLIKWMWFGNRQTVRTLKGSWTIQSAGDVNIHVSDNSIDELISILSDEITEEIENSKETYAKI